LTAGSSRCPACGGPAEPGARFCSRCGQALPAAAPELTYAPPGQASWGTVADVEAVGYDGNRTADRTRTGVLLMILSFALAWIPYVAFVGGILALIGIVFLWLGRAGFGPDHRRNVVAGCVCVLLGILVSLFAALWFASAVVSAAATTSTTLSGVGAALQSALEGLLVSAVVAGALGALGYVLLPYALADRTSRWLLWGGLVLSVALSVLLLTLLWPQLTAAIGQATSGTTINVAPVQAVETRETIVATVQFFPQMMFLTAYYRVRRRLMRGPGGAATSAGPSTPYGRLS